ncbi:protein phosphatase CheZ [Noviherbaspirillum sp. CPCC 100848]|uniref:Protein phosphatase CheZ n=1 Tax=Noviherbaspirillum album TaxID=3080276 RepID=A0ABU6JF74_9BURK|nr:protein phosphatase CheZ [Noviherbaspirillum sp. CPCC 100848]MEC4722188.1 protein phosphatase CheZ [Noviherbaspirillum sp. CPCC 100848]
MTDAADDLEALFDEVASQRTETVAAPAAEQETVSLDNEFAAAGAEPAEAVHEEHADPEDQSMYERLGGIVRMLHDSLRQLGYDRSLSDVASQITDAQGRLEHVASLTEQAANKVLNTVDTCIPEQEALQKQAKDMEDRWAQLFEGKLGIEEFKALAGDSKQFAAVVQEATESEKARLLDIMMAQDFQDITGQLIKKIVLITSTAEKELAQLLRDNAPPEVKAAMAESKPPVDLMQGPAAPGVAMAQDDVDSLLADLGF